MIAPRFPVARQPSQRRVVPSVRGRSTLDGAAGAVRDLAQRALLVPAFRALFAPFKVGGLEHLEGVDGPVIFAANHASHLDVPAVVAALPRARRRSLIVAAAEDYFYRSRLRRLLLNSTLSAYPFRRAGDPRWSLVRTEELLASGRSVLLFPEGTRSPDGAIGRFRRGVALVAARAGVPVVPTYIDGAAEALPKGAARPRRRPIGVTFCGPLRLDPGDSPAAFAEEIRKCLLAAGEVKGVRRWGG